MGPPFKCPSLWGAFGELQKISKVKYTGIMKEKKSVRGMGGDEMGWGRD